MRTEGTFKPGHGRVGGRRKGSPTKRTKLALEICEELDFHPAAFLATIALTGLMPNPDGTTTPVSTDDRLRAATALAPFVMPRLQATQVTGKDNGPVQVERILDVSAILANPALAAAAQELALMVVEAEGNAERLPGDRPLTLGPYQG
jgi:hypothetical protein